MVLRLLVLSLFVPFVTVALHVALRNRQSLASLSYGGRSDQKLSVSSESHLGRTAALSEAGYRLVAKSKSAVAMDAYARRVLASQHLKVLNEDFFAHVLPYYNGDCAQQSYDALLREVRRATEARDCHPAWAGDSQATENHDNTSWAYVNELPAPKRTAFNLIRGVIAELGGEVLSGQRGFWKFAQEFVFKANGTLKDLKRELSLHLQKTKDRKKHTWLKLPAENLKGGATKHFSKGGALDWVAEAGTLAPLNEDGYRAVMFLRNNSHMSTFVKRVIKNEGLNMLDTHTLAGFVPYYSGLCAQQGFNALVKELRSFHPVDFLTSVAYDFDSDESMTVENVRRAIATIAGISADQVNVTGVEFVQEPVVKQSSIGLPAKLVAKNPLPAQPVAKKLLSQVTNLASPIHTPAKNMTQSSKARIFLTLISKNATELESIESALTNVDRLHRGLNTTKAMKVHTRPRSRAARSPKCGGLASTMIRS